eukprot:364417-Chlamydomonas_euryale.AAC.10
MPPPEPSSWHPQIAGLYAAKGTLASGALCACPPASCSFCPPPTSADFQGCQNPGHCVHVRLPAAHFVPPTHTHTSAGCQGCQKSKALCARSPASRSFCSPPHFCRLPRTLASRAPCARPPASRSFRSTRRVSVARPSQGRPCLEAGGGGKRRDSAVPVGMCAHTHTCCGHVFFGGACGDAYA